MFASGEEMHMRVVVKQANVRCLVRILQLHANNALSEETWKGLLSIPFTKSENSRWVTDAKWIAMFAKKYTDTSLEEEEILDLLRRVSEHSR
jgi:hypothetical protein